jgi:disulfide oxidoreductase YuzD
MERREAKIFIYGAEQVCASCVNLPSSKETYEWLEAAISRKYPEQAFHIQYIDIYSPPEEEAIKLFATKVVEEDMFYPVVLINDTVVGEGNPRLKTIFSELEKHGYQAG